MPSNTCVVCGTTKKKGENLSMFRIPADPHRKKLWLEALGLVEEELKEHYRVCSKHFLHSDSSNIPSLNLGKRFSSPKKDTARKERAKKRALVSPVPAPGSSKAHCSRSQSTPVSSSRESSVTRHTPLSTTQSTDEESMVVSVGEPLLSDSSYSVHELPYEKEPEQESIVPLRARIEFMEAERSHESTIESMPSSARFRVEKIADKDELIRFYTGFDSYALFLRFFEFLGPAVYTLNYWGESKRKTARRVKEKALSPLNQYFLTLIKLRLNL